MVENRSQKYPQKCPKSRGVWRGPGGLLLAYPPYPWGGPGIAQKCPKPVPPGGYAKPTFRPPEAQKYPIPIHFLRGVGGVSKNTHF